MTIAAGGTVEERLLVLASICAPTDEEAAELGRLAHAVTDWDEFLALAKVNATAPLVQHRLEREGLFDLVPADIRAGFQTITDTVADANDRRLAGAIEMLRRFDEAGIRCVVLKGVLFAVEVYRDPRYKRMNDIDILIELDQVDAAIQVYRDLGMFSVTEILGKEPKARVKRSHHLPSFVSRDGSLVVGTHWGLITPLAPYTIDYDAIWSRVRKIDFYGVPAWAMSHEDNLHHLCIHLPYYKTGVRELGDIWNLIRYAGADLDFDLLAGEVRKAGSENLIYHALELVDRLVPDARCEELVRKVEPKTDRFYRYDVARKTRDIHALLRSRSTHTSRIEKAYTEFNATSDAKEKLGAFVNLWSNLLVVPEDEASKMSSLREASAVSKVGARVSAPYRLTRVFQRDLGPWLFPAALAKTFFDLGESAVNHVRKGDEQPIDLTAFAAKVGMTREQLQAVVDSQE